MITLDDLKKAEIGKAWVAHKDGLKYRLLGLSIYEDLAYVEYGARNGCYSVQVSELENYQLLHIEPPKPKKRYWLWTVKIEGEGIYKSENYMDDNARKTNGRSFLRKSDLFKKHEDEFIDVEVE